jgi:L-galactose dehydrogenase/L-glyceraldehyde 3-phosphate reductase
LPAVIYHQASNSGQRESFVEQRDLGNTGLKVSALGFGCGAVGGLMIGGDPAEQTRAVARALEAGITYFDTAPAYGSGRSEENLGRALRELSAWDKVIVGTKVRLEADDLADPTAALRRSLQASLGRLGHDSVDLYQLHNHIELSGDPARGRLDLSDVIGEIAEGFKQLRTEGLCRFIGFTGLGDTHALHETAIADDFDTVQAYFNVINPSAGYTGDCGDEQDFEGLINTAARAGLGVIAIRVLAAGALTGVLERHPIAGSVGSALAGGAEYARDVERAKRLPAVVAELGLESPFELALRFALAKEGVSTILAGMSEYAHLENFLRWTERGPLSAEVARRLVDEAF